MTIYSGNSEYLHVVICVKKLASQPTCACMFLHDIIL